MRICHRGGRAGSSNRGCEKIIARKCSCSFHVHCQSVLTCFHICALSTYEESDHVRFGGVLTRCCASCGRVTLRAAFIVVLFGVPCRRERGNACACTVFGLFLVCCEQCTTKSFRAPRARARGCVRCGRSAHDRCRSVECEWAPLALLCVLWDCGESLVLVHGGCRVHTYLETPKASPHFFVTRGTVPTQYVPVYRL